MTSLARFAIIQTLIVHSMHSAKNTALRTISPDLALSLRQIPFHQDNYSFQFDPDNN